MSRRTTLSIEGDGFLINGNPTHAGRVWNGMKIEGLLFNSRMVQGIFDDLDPDTRSMWNYPDGPWDAERNTREFVAAMPDWHARGLLSFTICLQGGSPQGYSKEQPWHNSAFRGDGSLREDYMRRLEHILDRADELGMIAILGLFYQAQDQRVATEADVIRGVENAIDWIVERRYANVMIEIGNEVDHSGFTHEIIRHERTHELIRLVQERSHGRIASPAGRLLVSASMGARGIPPENITEAADFLLIHGNGVDDPDDIRKMVEGCRAVETYRGQPIVFNEDDHFAFDAEDNHMVAAISRGASWGYFDWRMPGESFDDGYQSVPVNWSISSERKRGFFRLLSEITGSESGRGAGEGD